MIPKETLGVGEMGYKFDKFALFDFCFGKGHIRFWNSSNIFLTKRNMMLHMESV